MVIFFLWCIFRRRLFRGKCGLLDEDIRGFCMLELRNFLINHWYCLE